jgi:DNA-binding HxlR family transcriptional regulator
MRVGWAELDSRTCSLARTLEIAGQPWTLLVLRDLFNGIRRFDDLAGHLGIARNVLADRLARLAGSGLAKRVPYRQPGHRARHEYRLTGAGVDLCTVMVAFAGWGDRHLAGAVGPPARFEHRGCGAPVRAALLCGHGHLLTPSDRVLSRRQHGNGPAGGVGGADRQGLGVAHGLGPAGRGDRPGITPGFCVMDRGYDANDVYMTVEGKASGPCSRCGRLRRQGRMADLIVVLDKDRIAASGDHAALIRAVGLHAELYELQAHSYRCARTVTRALTEPPRRLANPRAPWRHY